MDQLLYIRSLEQVLNWENIGLNLYFYIDFVVAGDGDISNSHLVMIQS